jgi:hypothetical protein
VQPQPDRHATFFGSAETGWNDERKGALTSHIGSEE